MRSKVKRGRGRLALLTRNRTVSALAWSLPAGPLHCRAFLRPAARQDPTVQRNMTTKNRDESVLISVALMCLAAALVFVLWSMTP